MASGVAVITETALARRRLVVLAEIDIMIKIILLNPA
jgi:hypothetical protein